MLKVYNPLKKLLRRIGKMATYLTVIGAMLVPLGVLLAVEVPNWKWLAFLLIVVGLISVISGLVYTIREEQRRDREDKLRCKEDELRIRREKASLIVLIFMADAFGVDASELLEMEKKHLDEK